MAFKCSSAAISFACSVLNFEMLVIDFEVKFTGSLCVCVCVCLFLFSFVFSF